MLDATSLTVSVDPLLTMPFTHTERVLRSGCNKRGKKGKKQRLLKGWTESVLQTLS